MCVASRKYLAQHGTPKKPADLASHNCRIDGDMRAWPFVGGDVPVRGNPQRRFVPPRVRRVTDYFAAALPPRM